MLGEGGVHGLSRKAEAFLAGVLAHLPGLCPFFLASPNSYERAKPSSWAGAYQARCSCAM